MNKKWQSPVRRMLALLLCATLLLGMFPMLQQEAKAVDTDAGLLWLDGQITSSTPVETDMYLDYYRPYTYSDNIWGGSKLLIRSAKWGHVMSYNPDRPNATSYTGSLVYDNDGDSLGTYYEVAGYAAEAGIQPGQIYFDPSVRNDALWIIRQMIDTSSNTYSNEAAYDGQAMHSTTGQFVDMNPLFGGKIFPGVHLQKGTTAGQTERFWYNDGVNEDSSLFRHLCFRIESASSRPFTSTAVWNEQSKDWTPRGYIVEMLSDGRCLIYFRMNWRDMRVLNCDENGNCTVKRYQYPASMGDDMAAALAPIIADEGNFVRLYAYEDTASRYKSLSYKGYTEYNLAKDIAQSEVLEYISENITVFDPEHRNLHVPFESDSGNLNGLGKLGYYRLQLPSSFNVNRAGTYTVNIVYNSRNGNETIGSVTVNILEGSTSINSNTGVVSKNAADGFTVYTSANSETPATFTYTAGGRSVQVPITLNMLRTRGNARVDTSKPGSYPNLVLTYNGIEVTRSFVLTVSSTTCKGDLPVYPAPGAVDVTKVSTTSQDDFYKNGDGNGVATINLAVKGKHSTKGVDLVIIMDLSSSMRYAVDGNTQVAANNTEENWDQTRLYKMEQALKVMINKMQDDNMDVRIAMADFGDLDHFEFADAVIDQDHAAWPQIEMVGGYDNQHYAGAETASKFFAVNHNTEIANQLNFVLGKGDKDATSPSGGNSDNSQTFYLHPYKYDSNMTSGFTGKILPQVYTGSKKVNADAFVDINTLTSASMDNIILAIDAQNQNMLGTNYDVGLEYAYRLAYARQQQNIVNGEDRMVTCIFMSDGAAMQYNYFSGRAQSEAWSQYLVGNTDEITTNYDKAYKWNINDLSTMHPGLRWTIERMRVMLHKGQLWYVDHNAGHNPNGSHPTTATTASGVGHKDPNGLTYSSNAVYWPGPDGDNCGSLDTNGNGAGLVGAFPGHTSGHTLDWYDLFELIYENRKNPAMYAAPNPFGTVDNKGEEFDYQKLIQYLREPGYTIGNFMAGANNDWDANNDGVLDAGKVNTLLNDRYQHQTYSPYWYFYNTEGKNWWAEAMKGDTNEVYPVINRHVGKTVTTAENGKWNGDLYLGEVRNKFTGTTAPGYMQGKEYISGFKGLGLDIYTIGFAITADDHMISVDEATTVLKNVATRPAMFYNTTDTDDLTAALSSIVSSATSSASGSWFTDTMGEEYDLLTSANSEGKNVTPIITLKEYAVDAAGNRTHVVSTWETITFGGNGVAYLNGDTSKDIWGNDGGIRGDYLYFNTNKTGTILLENIRNTGLNYNLPAETFFWSIGNVTETELVLEYKVYLNGSMEGTLSNVDTEYPTNKEAIFHYKDELGNMVNHETVSPVFTWSESPSYTYGIYLVDSNGNPIKSNGASASGISDALKLGSTTVDLKITSDPTVNSLNVADVFAELGLDPNLYEIYDPNAQVTITSQKTQQSHNVDVTDSTSKKTTYVGSSKSDKNGLDNTGLKNNAIYFAVKLKDYSTAVNYGIYLVDEEGNPIYTNGSPANGPVEAGIKTGSTTIAVTGDSSQRTFTVEEVMASLGLSADAYEIYSPGAQVTITSDKAQRTHDMDITDGGDPVTTFVGETKTDKDNLNDTGLANNRIWFAVKLADYAAQVDYGIYLVDGNGDPIKADGSPASNPTGAELGSDFITINVTNDITNTTLTAQDALTDMGLDPDIYELYSPSSKVEITSDKAQKNHDLDITDSGDPKTTYVGDDTTDKQNVGSGDLDDNKVWFAVKLKDYEVSLDYGIYLVDSEGKPIKTDGTPASNPNGAALKSDTLNITVSDDITRNTLDAEEILRQMGLDPNVYELYSPDTKVEITSDKAQRNNDLLITDAADTKTTFVGEGTTSKENVSNDDLDDNKVWFAVKLKDYDATVNYGIYLVDGNGNPIKTDGTPAGTPSGAELKSGSDTITISGDTVTNTYTVEDVLRALNLNSASYEIFSPGSQVVITSDKAQKDHDLDITDTAATKTTYVGNDKSDKQNVSNDALGTNKIWFAVKLSDFKTVVNFGIYLVDGNGEPIQKDGQPADTLDDANLGNGSLGIDVTDDITHTTLTAEDALKELGLDPDLYEIFSPDTKVEISSDKAQQTHDVDITDNTDPKTTYVGDDKTDKEDQNNDELAENKIQFAVKLKNRGTADTVVVDYGLPVDVDVLANDGFGADSTLVGYQASASYGSAVSVPDASSNGVRNVVTSISDSYADVTISNNLSRWQAKNMMFSNYYMYAYCALDSATGHHYWSSVTVIPATSIYYEDSFVSFNQGDLATEGWSWAQWQTQGEALSDTQNQDRPGIQASKIDANKIYGSDDAYASTETYSGAARWTQVAPNSPARASFTFTGTGFDVISLTSRKTGSVMVFIYEAETFEKFDDPSTVEFDGTQPIPEQVMLVNTYYSLEDTLYQVPVIKCNDLKYGTYVVEILVAYDEWFAEQGHDDGMFDFYLDSIRVYNPAGIVSSGSDNTIYDAYTQDGERWPRYQELRNMILAPEAVDGKVTSTTDLSGMLFIDSRLLNSGKVSYSQYASWGPNNELYMNTDDLVYFKLNTTKYLSEAFNDSDDEALAGVDKIHIAMRALEGTSMVLIASGAKSYVYDVSSTDMYFDITELANQNVTIQVIGDAPVSITNIKVTHTAMPDDYLAELGQAKARRAMAATGNVLNVNAPSMASLITVNGAMAAELLDELNKEQDPSAVITPKYASLSFNDLIHTNIYFQVDGFNAENLGLAVFAGNDVDGTVDTAAYVVGGATLVDGMYKVSTQGIPAKNLGDTIYFKVFAVEADGSYTYSKLLTYSPLEYANFLLSSGDMDKTLAAAMLNYGAEAQTYFGYNTDALMNAAVTEEAKALLAGYSISDLEALDAVDAAKVGAFVETDGFAAKYPSVSFKGAFRINYYFTPAAQVDGDVTFYYWTEDTYNAAAELTADNADSTAVMTADNGIYSAVSGAIYAKDLDKTVYVAAVYESNGVTHCTGVLAYSVAEYARSFADTTDAFAPFAQAIGTYGSVAKAYFGN